MVVGDLCDQLVLAPGLCKVFDLETLLDESLDSVLADVFKQKELQFLLCYWVENLRLADLAEQRVMAGEAAAQGWG